MTSVYQIRSFAPLSGFSPGISFLRDAPSKRRKGSIEFHIEKNDYFGTLATVLGLIADSLVNGNDEVREVSVKNLIDLRDEFVYLQSTHSISRKDKN